MKWLDECPTSKQEGKAGRQGRQADRGSSPSTGASVLTGQAPARSGRGWYWSTANKTEEPASRKQRDSATAAACLLLHLIDFRKWRKIVSKRQDKVSSGQSRNWNCTMPAPWCVCMCVFGCEPVICIGFWVKSTYLSFIIGFNVDASKFNLGRAYEALRWIWCKQSMHVFVCLCVYVWVCMQNSWIRKQKDESTMKII